MTLWNVTLADEVAAAFDATYEQTPDIKGMMHFLS
jgi:hypothetical protein